MRVQGKSSIGIIILSVVVTVVIIGLAGIAGYFYWQNRQLQSNVAQYSGIEQKYQNLLAASPQGVTGLNDAERIVKQVSLLAELPQKEIPTLITIDNKDTVKNIDFFKTAELGDVVLAYQQSKFAVLFRPSTYKIITMGPQTFTVGTK